MLRGYIRLQAESHGVNLHDTNVNVLKKLSANATSTCVGYNASKLPASVRTKNKGQMANLSLLQTMAANKRIFVSLNLCFGIMNCTLC